MNDSWSTRATRLCGRCSLTKNSATSICRSKSDGRPLWCPQTWQQPVRRQPRLPRRENGQTRPGSTARPTTTSGTMTLRRDRTDQIDREWQADWRGRTGHEVGAPVRVRSRHGTPAWPIEIGSPSGHGARRVDAPTQPHPTKPAPYDCQGVSEAGPDRFHSRAKRRSARHAEEVQVRSAGARRRSSRAKAVCERRRRFPRHRAMRSGKVWHGTLK